jgi:soluble cytochrome b562
LKYSKNVTPKILSDNGHDLVIMFRDLNFKIDLKDENSMTKSIKNFLKVVDIYYSEHKEKIIVLQKQDLILNNYIRECLISYLVNAEEKRDYHFESYDGTVDQSKLTKKQRQQMKADNRFKANKKAIHPDSINFDDYKVTFDKQVKDGFILDDGNIDPDVFDYNSNDDSWYNKTQDSSEMPDVNDHSNRWWQEGKGNETEILTNDSKITEDIKPTTKVWWQKSELELLKEKIIHLENKIASKLQDNINKTNSEIKDFNKKINNLVDLNEDNPKRHKLKPVKPAHKVKVEGNKRIEDRFEVINRDSKVAPVSGQNTPCKYWLQNKCTRVDCPFMHGLSEKKEAVLNTKPDLPLGNKYVYPIDNLGKPVEEGEIYSGTAFNFMGKATTILHVLTDEYIKQNRIDNICYLSKLPAKIKALKPTDVKNIKVGVPVYVIKRGGNSEGKVTSLDKHGITFTHNANTTFGDSGSPIVINVDGVWRVVGVHMSTSGGANNAMILYPKNY